ncbi:MAG: chemotaxis response regulator protein-glutamate methylesterase of group 2 operon [Methyloligella sp.]|nr:MAG: chemotaxis response regulator protein-glutamate methylesterase of group 2 operon [Methyloligella sp.]
MTAIAQNLSARSGSAVSATNSIRVMVVDDSVVVRGLVSKWVDEEAGMESIGKCSNGAKAVEEVKALNPDVIVLDIEMPVMDGLEALPKILKLCPGVKVIMASTLTQRNAEISLKALSLGASDYVPKPVSNSGVTTSSAFKIDLINKIKALGSTLLKQKAKIAPARPAVVTAKTPTAKPTAAVSPSAGSDDGYSLREYSKKPPRILIVGSSTGGPPALISVLEELAPALKQIPVLVTQHMPATFTKIFAEHLGRAAGLPSAEGIDGEQVHSGKIYVAPGGRHMILERKGAFPIIRLTDGPEVNFCKPAVDPLFESVAKCYGATTLSIVLTGMGSDGAKGAKIVADAGGSVIAQDEATSVVWGMPGATAKIGACSEVLPLKQIAPKLKQLITGQAR